MQIWSEMRVLETRSLRTGLVWRRACSSAWWGLRALHPRGLGPLGRHRPCWALVNEGDPGPGLGSLQPARLPREFTPCAYSIADASSVPGTRWALGRQRLRARGAPTA